MAAAVPALLHLRHHRPLQRPRHLADHLRPAAVLRHRVEAPAHRVCLRGRPVTLMLVVSKLFTRVRCVRHVGGHEARIRRLPPFGAAAPALDHRQARLPHRAPPHPVPLARALLAQAPDRPVPVQVDREIVAT